MKRIIITSMLLFVFLSCNNSKVLETPEEFGTTFLEFAKNENLDGLLSMRVAGDELNDIIDSSPLSLEEKESYSNLLITEDSDDKLVHNITKGLNRFIDNIKESEGQLKDVKFVNVMDNTNEINPLSTPMGNIEIEYSSLKQTGLISIESIKTHNGWKIFDDVLITYK